MLTTLNLLKNLQNFLYIKLKRYIYLSQINLHLQCCRSAYNEIVEEFNYHFVIIGKSLASSINNIDKSPTFYLKNSCTNSVYLQPTSTHEVMALINLLNLKKANGHDDIDPYFLKIASPMIAFPLSLFFNHSISLGIFPNKLKLAKVIPVYKKKIC